MRIGFTGTQRGMTNWQKEEFRKLLPLLNCDEFIFGDCIGSDIEAAYIAIQEGVKIFQIFPQNKDTRKRAWFLNDERDITRENGQYREVVNGIQGKWHPGKAPLERNKLIVEASDQMIATPKEFEHSLRSGTWATIRYAWKLKKTVTNIPPKEYTDDIN